MVARTLTQHAVPMTFGLKAAQWLGGLLDARDDVRRVRTELRLQAGGAAGTRSALVELAGPDAATTVREVIDRSAEAVGLRAGAPWHTTRTPITRAGDALATVTQACGRLAADVLTAARPEIAELREPAGVGRGGSSTMPQKQNPVLSVLIRRTAITAPGLAATLHTAAGLADDERPDGAWHAEWATLRDLARRSVVAVSQTAELCAGLVVDADAMAARADANAAGLLAERAAVRRLLPGTDAPESPEPTGTSDAEVRTYLGANDPIIDEILARAAGQEDQQ